MRILVASNNPGKVAEFRTILGGVVDVVTPNEFPELSGFDVEESGSTYQENSELKARGFAEKSGLVSIADDSGLEIAALEGKPGVHSKRFFSGSDDDRNAHILKLLEGVEDRSARFVCGITIYFPETAQAEYFVGVVPGKISTEITSGEGFAYDRIFIPKGYEATFAQLGVAIKNQQSHRGRALEKAKLFFQNNT